MCVLTISGCDINSQHPASERKPIPKADLSGKPDVHYSQLPLLKEVDHFFATSSEPEKLFTFFRDDLDLPEAWAYKNWGDFASGGVWMGNVAFEVVTWKPAKGETLATEFAGIAFEPAGYTDGLVKELARRRIAHSSPEPTHVKDQQGRQVVGWINTGLNGDGGVPPSNVAIFVYDATNKGEVAAWEGRLNAKLLDAQGGPLGVVAVKELAIGVVDLKSAKNKWRSLLDHPDQESGDEYRFGRGPRIRLFAAATDGVKGIVVQVRSLRDAEMFLAQRNLLDKSREGTLAIKSSAIGGLHITLEQ